MNIPRAWQPATLLPEGKILIAGGFNSGSTPEPFESSELYDPATGTFSFAGRFSPVGSATAWHYEHQAALLQNGKVLIAGGRGYGGATADAQPYDPATDTYTSRRTHAGPAPRAIGHSARGRHSVDRRGPEWSRLGVRPRGTLRSGQRHLQLYRQHVHGARSADGHSPPRRARARGGWGRRGRGGGSPRANFPCPGGGA